MESISAGKRFIALLSQIFFGCLLIFPHGLLPSSQTYQSVKEPNWPVSTPEAQGMDSATLAGIIDQVQKDGRNIHSILIARHGKLVFSAYFAPFNRETPHNIYSCTKSVTSALTGIALDKGLIQGINTPVSTLFPETVLDSPEKEQITLRHLLTMSSGIEWTEPLRSGLSDIWSFSESDSPPQYFFDRALINPPGKVFNYNTGGSHLLSMIIQNSAGMTMEEFARDNLFEPIGISDYTWGKDNLGFTTGGTGLALRSEDMLKLGQLFLQNGVWENKQVIPTNWVKDSTSSQIKIGPGINYGYQWWVRPNGMFNALGWGGQQIIVSPAQDLVIVFTSGIRDAGWNTYDDLIKTHILPSIRSNHALTVNNMAASRLNEKINAISKPPTQIPSAATTSLSKINGIEYVDLNGTHGWSTFTFNFDSQNEGGMTLVYGDKSEEINARIGLDGLFRVNETKNYGPVAFKGYWKSDREFALTQQFLKEAEQLTMVLKFTDSGIIRNTEWTVEDHNEISEAVPLMK